MARVWGVDLEEQRNQVSDVAHYAALLDDHRQEFSLASLCRDFLPPDEQKVLVVDGWKLDPARMAYYPPGMIAVRAVGDVRQVKLLRDIFWPKMTQLGLQKVRQLEDEIIYVVCEMEKNGAKIDVELLDRWVTETQRIIEKGYRRLYELTGFRLNVNSSSDMARLWTKIGIPLEYTAPSASHPEGQPSFTTDILKKHRHHSEETEIAFTISKLMDLRNSYLLPYAQLVDRSTGILRFAMHQLPSQKDEWNERDTAGTISGRFSSTRLTKAPVEGFGIQRTIKPAKQRTMFGYDEEDDSHDDELFIIRRLHVPDKTDHPNALFLSADAMQIEYRLFAEETKSDRLARIYEENPKASFHKETHKMWKVYKPDLTYRRNKDTNFAQIYGAGTRKKAWMLGFITKQRYLELLHDDNWRDAPDLKEAFEVEALYNRMIPEVKPMMKKAEELAKNRGYIKSILGRRSTFPGGERAHKALNTRIQPSAADIMKQKLVELHKVSRQIGFLLRYTVHDEVDGDARGGIETVREVHKILNRQSFKTRIPILWETNYGPNWRDIQEYNEAA